jgi:hypothetical protein
MLCSLGLAAVAGCGRRGLFPGTVDGGVSRASPDLGEAMIRDVGSAGEADASITVKTDLTT